VEIIFQNKNGKLPNLNEALESEFRDQPITAAVFIEKKKDNLEISIKWVNRKYINEIGEEKLTEIIKERIRDKNYDLLLEDGGTGLLIV